MQRYEDLFAKEKESISQNLDTFLQEYTVWENMENIVKQMKHKPNIEHQFNVGLLSREKYDQFVEFEKNANLFSDLLI